MKFSLKRIVRPLIIVVIGVGIAVMMVSSRKPIPVEPGPQRLPYVELETIALGQQNILVKAHGNVISSQVLAFSSEVSGPVIWKSPKLEVGEYVAAGEVLLKVEPIPYQLALSQAKATLASAKVALADAEALQRKARVEEAKANIEAAESLVRKAQLDLTKTTIVAPFNAIVDSAPVEIAQYLTPGKLVANLLGTDMAEVHMPLVQSDAVYLANNRSSDVKVRRDINGEAYAWTGRFVRLEGRLDEKARVINAVVEIPNPYQQDSAGLPLVFGAFVEVEMFGAPAENAALIPQLALHSESTVYVFENGLLRKRKVDIVHADGHGWIVVRGLQNGERLVTNRLELMYDSMPVAVKDEQ